MSATYQACLCLSCGAPFLPETKDVEVFNRQGNISLLYIHNKTRNSVLLKGIYNEPHFSAEKAAAHMFHTSHHSNAIDYMCRHHHGDDAPQLLSGVRDTLGDVNSMFPFYFGAVSGKARPSLAVWERPLQADRLDYSPLRDFVAGVKKMDRDAKFDVSLNVTYPCCRGCNSIMTQLSHMRYLVGFTSTGAKNPHGTIISAGKTPISVYSAKATSIDVMSAYGHWTLKNFSNSKFPGGERSEDPLSPHIAYYLHLCMPFMAQADQDFFEQQARLQGSVVAARTMYVQLSWLVLIIACLATQLDEGLVGGGKLSWGLHQHYGTLDIYVSFFIWRMCLYEYGSVLPQNALDFIQWHQKYFWGAVYLPGFDRSSPIVGVTVFSSVRRNARDLVEEICRELVALYHGPLRVLIQHVTGHIPVPMDGLSNEQWFVRCYFPSRAALQQLANTRDSLVGCVFSLCRALSMFLSNLPPLFFGRSGRTTSSRRWRLSVWTLYCSG
jgi:hypothetical protein